MLFKSFLNTVDRLIKRHFPKKPIPKTKPWIKSKPWITLALLKFPTLKKLRTESTNNSENQVAQIRKEHFMSDSRIIEISKPILTRVSKEEYYKLFFQESKKQ